MKTLVVICGLIGLFGIVGTPDYVADVERENENLRARVASLEGSRYSCGELVAEHPVSKARAAIAKATGEPQ